MIPLPAERDELFKRFARGIERYSFADGRLATKDVYRKPL
jgi:hypothetical protein